jgi:hypothetical protein
VQSPFLRLPCAVLALAAFSGTRASAWVNPGFEQLPYGTGWTFNTSAVTGATINAPESVVVNNNVGPGFGQAPYTNPGQLNMVHSGNYAGGIFSGNGDLNHSDWASISQSDVVPAGSSCITGYFAAVLSGWHYVNSQPYDSDAYVLLQLMVGGVPVHTQRFSWYDNASQLVDPGAPFDQTYLVGSTVMSSDNGPWKYLPWTQYSYDMSAYVGQTVTLVYTAYSCDQVQHYAYGFLDDVAWVACPPTPTFSATPSVTPTGTRTVTETVTLTFTKTFTVTWSPTNSPTPSQTPTASPSFSASPTFSATPTSTPSPSGTPTATPSGTATLSATPTDSPSTTPTYSDSPTASPTPTPSDSPSATPTVTQTSTATLTSSPTPSSTSSPTWTPTATPSDSPSTTPTATQTSTATPSSSPTPSSTSSPTWTPTATPSDSATCTPSATPTWTATPTFSPTPTPTWTPTRTASPSATPTGTPTATPTWTPTCTASPSATPTGTPTATKTVTPTWTPSPTASPTFTATETATPTSTWTQTSTWSPTSTATPSRTASPTVTQTYTATPTHSPSPTASATPTITWTFTVSPTASPTPLPETYGLFVGIYNSAGELVRTLYNGQAQFASPQFSPSASAFIPGSSPLALQFLGQFPGSNSQLSWNGLNNQGQDVIPGIYTIKVQDTDPYGKIQVFTQAVNVLPSEPAASLVVYNSAGEAVAHLSLAAYPQAVTVFSLTQTAFAVSGGSPAAVPITLQGDQGASYTMTWVPQNDLGSTLSSGVYTIRLVQWSDGRQVVESKQITLLNAPGNDGGATLAPNPVQGGSPRVTLSYGTDSPGSQASARLYNLAGELVLNAAATGPGKLEFNVGSLAGGIYVVCFELRDGNALLRRQRIKLAILR